MGQASGGGQHGTCRWSQQRQACEARRLLRTILRPVLSHPQHGAFEPEEADEETEEGQDGDLEEEAKALFGNNFH